MKLDYETPGPLRWRERFPWKRVLVIVGMATAIVVATFGVIFLARTA
jgi:hypothetical protein